MAIYKFKISFEDFDDVVREIDIKSNQTFEDLHRALHKSIGYNAPVDGFSAILMVPPVNINSTDFCSSTLISF